MTKDRIIAETEIIRTTPSAYVSRIMTGWLGSYGWIAVTIFGICGAMAALRWEWLIVALILLLIVYPFVLAMVYFRYGLSPEHLVLTRPIRVTVTDSALLVDIMEATREDISAEEKTTYRPIRRAVLNYSLVKNVTNLKDSLLIRLKEPRYATLCIPDCKWICNDTCEGGAQIRAAVVEALTKNGIKFA